MCCCYVDQCCCGCTDQKTGIGIWAIIDAALNVGFIIFLALTAGIGGPQIWNILLIVADVLLAIGTLMKNPNSCLIIFWQIIMMIEIILLFFCWLLIPILLLVYVVANEVTKVHNEACEKANEGLDNNDWNNMVENHCDEHSDNINDGMKDLEMALFACIAIVIILPIIYIYWWVVVNSFRKSVVMRNMGVLPIQQPVMLIQQQQPNTMAPVDTTSQPPPYY